MSYSIIKIKDIFTKNTLKNKKKYKLNVLNCFRALILTIRATRSFVLISPKIKLYKL